MSGTGEEKPEGDGALVGGRVLVEVEAKRGYRLPYHRMLARHAAELLHEYDRFYTALTLAPRVVSTRERELIWTALLVASREEQGTIHMRRAEAAGLDAAALADAAAIAAAVEAYPAMRFGPTHWQRWIPDAQASPRYLKLFETARGGLDPALAEILALVCHAARRTHDGMRVHLPRAFAAGVTPEALAEGLSYLLLPCGGPTLIDAVQCWADAAEAGGIPSPY
ncbi:MAG: carboxymuconolactone decarboxylase family protein [Azospirillaceae bacterium]